MNTVVNAVQVGVSVTAQTEGIEIAEDEMKMRVASTLMRGHHLRRALDIALVHLQDRDQVRSHRIVRAVGACQPTVSMAAVHVISRVVAAFLPIEWRRDYSLVHADWNRYAGTMQTDHWKQCLRLLLYELLLLELGELFRQDFPAVGDHREGLDGGGGEAIGAIASRQ